VNRPLKVLEAEKLIQRQSSRSVTIGHWKKLDEAGDFDSTYLHLHENEVALESPASKPLRLCATVNRALSTARVRTH
jgi:hypothetical protein